MKDSADRLRQAREAAGFTTAKEAADAMGVPVSTYIQHENGARGYPATRAQKYASFFRVTPEFLVYGRSAGRRSKPEPALGLLPISGNIQAGTWLESDDMDQREPEMRAAAPDPRFPHARQWLMRVFGDSMNALEHNGRPAGILEGDLVHCVDAMAIDYQPVTGDIVEVERVRFGGAMRERTLKQVEIVRALPHPEYLLWPRSTNPRWKEPIAFRDGVQDGEEVEVIIRGKVLQVLRVL